MVGAVLIAASRLRDNYHRWVDVLVGFAVGVLCALFTVDVVFDFVFRRPAAAKETN